MLGMKIPLRTEAGGHFAHEGIRWQTNLPLRIRSYETPAGPLGYCRE